MQRLTKACENIMNPATLLMALGSVSLNALAIAKGLRIGWVECCTAAFSAARPRSTATKTAPSAQAPPEQKADEGFVKRIRLEKRPIQIDDKRGRKSLGISHTRNVIVKPPPQINIRMISILYNTRRGCFNVASPTQPCDQPYFNAKFFPAPYNR